MNSWYDLHSWSTQLREEGLREARKQDLIQRARIKGSSRVDHSPADHILQNTLSLLRRVILAQ